MSWLSCSSFHNFIINDLLTEIEIVMCIVFLYIFCFYKFCESSQAIKFGNISKLLLSETYVMIKRDISRGSSVMVIITPRGEIVKSVISVDGNIIKPRDVVQDTIVEEKTSDKTALTDPHNKRPHNTPPLKLLSYVDKGTHVTERSFTKQSTSKRMSPR